MNRIWVTIAVMALVTYLIRVLPLTLIRKPIQNRWIRSFLYYVPYAALAVMTFPAIMNSTLQPLAGLCAFAVGIVMTWLGSGLFPAAAVCCTLVFVLEKIL